jgi:hypothetical protein
MYRPSAVTDEMVVQIRAMAGKMPSKEIARRLGIPNSLLANRARLYRISLRSNHTVAAPAMEAQIKNLIGKLTGKEIAQRLGLNYRSLCDWASRRGIALRGHRLVARTNVYHRLMNLARRAGLRLSWSSPDGGITLSEVIAEGLSAEEAESFLRGKLQLCDVIETAHDRAYDRANGKLNGNGNGLHSVGAAALCPGGYDALIRLRMALAPKLVVVILPQPQLGGVARLYQ